MLIYYCDDCGGGGGGDDGYDDRGYGDHREAIGVLPLPREPLHVRCAPGGHSDGKKKQPTSSGQSIICFFLKKNPPISKPKG